jgi:ascorbate-specific PTS system EIIC-type component UlaA
MNKYRIALILTAVAGFLAVAVGAFGAHALKSLLTANNRLDTFELASRYHFYHTLVLLGISLLLKQTDSKRFFISLVFILTGMIFVQRKFVYPGHNQLYFNRHDYPGWRFIPFGRMGCITLRCI